MDNYKIKLLFDIAKDSLHESGCLRRQYSAVICGDDGLVVGMGTNKSPRGIEDCNKKPKYDCIRISKNVKHGTCYEICAAVHAEQNAIICAGNKCEKGSLFLVGMENEELIDARPCNLCLRLIIQSGIEKIYCLNKDNSYHVIECDKITFEDIVK